ncbi:regulator of protease activity HflC (stomatin/prohibitin superfamily) [Rubricella aquisinus]|uniref:Regulator of protease activity HflC (Stomatin/prohibitin superfamily) n=1 Tax=Rubricella aquisinus TaxID=2028108 RepID=A0A840WRL4_9RHOB|nr:prohibitin family protein [Rubricella aquisinus]MBB5516312.1 regulator of protease activity HflC (stomatin/prohibitin superfamily) [Rubricella aquisinus]
MSAEDTTKKGTKPKRKRPSKLRLWLSGWRSRNGFGMAMILLVFLFVGAIALPRAIVQIPAGHAGVLWARFAGGTITDFHLDEGLRFIWPWDEVYIYDTRLRTIARTYDTISSNGLSMQVEIAVRFRVNKDSVGTLHQLIGPNYPDVLINPEIGSHARELISRYTPEQLYTETRAFIQAQILERMATQLGSSLIAQGLSGQLVFVEDVLIRSVTLPSSVVEAIERKEQQYQVVLEYDFRLQREELERQRKNIEAQGIREFQDIVSDTITDEYLRLRGIDATLAIATSNNSKMVVMGGSDGLPVILNTGAFEQGGGDDETLEPITAPLAPNAAVVEPLSTSAVQPDNDRLQGTRSPQTRTTGSRPVTTSTISPAENADNRALPEGVSDNADEPPTLTQSPPSNAEQSPPSNAAQSAPAPAAPSPSSSTTRP